ncbi:MAG: DM13 domain-containing protein [Verrucomicrobia bacterium]|nr:DM13 domain-containing protein [Cytophagales bacterium]
MKNLLKIMTINVLFVIALTACKVEEATPTMPPVAEKEKIEQVQLGTLLRSGSFVSNVHSTSGSAKLYEKDGVKNLVFQNFKTDNGPDLRVYLSKNTTASDFRELGKLKAVSGDFTYEVPAAINTSEYPFVLIWCEDFSVLFGNSELKN